MSNSYRFLEFIQNSNKFYVITIKISELINMYEIDYYDSKYNPKGYQRQIQSNHRKKIIDYLMEDDNPIMNTAIIGSIEYSQIKYNQDSISFEKNIKIVDGQHRLEAFRKLKQDNPDEFNYKFNDYSIPLIIIPIEDTSLVEIETFININNKNKRVSTALAQSLLEEIRKEKNKDLYEKTINIDPQNIKKRQELVSSIAHRMVELINGNPKGLWFEHVKFGDGNNKYKTISINAFISTLIPIIDKYTQLKYYDQINIEETIDKLTKLIENAWIIVEKKWYIAMNNNGYNIQKGIGVYPLHHILEESLEKDLECTLEKFRVIIERSSVINDDWYLGGKFSFLNSKAGFKEIEQYIKNQKV